MAHAVPQSPAPNVAAPARAIDVTRLRPVPNPRGTALALEALLRFANGTPPSTAMDKLIATRLGGLPNGRAIAKRLVGPFERLSPEARARALPGVPDLATLGARAADPKALATASTASAAGLAAGPVSRVFGGTELPSQSSQSTSAYEISYAGIKANATVQGTDHVAVLAAWVTHSANKPYVVTEKLFPASGTTELASNAASSAGAGSLYKGAELGYTNDDSGALLVETVLIDAGGDLATQKQDIDLLMTLADTFASTLPGKDRIGALKTAIAYCAGTLHLTNPEKWSVNPISTRTVSGGDYDTMFNAQASVASGISSKLSLNVAPKTGDYSVFYSTPTYQSNLTPVTVTVTAITSTGAVHDTENGLADFAGRIGIGDAMTDIKTFPANKNTVTTSWKVLRKVLNNQKIQVTVNLYEMDAAPTYKENKAPICSSYCATEPWPNALVSCDYSGPCGPIYNDVDVSPNPGTGSASSSGGGWGSPPVSSGITAFTLVLEYDMATGIITGDKAVKKGVAVSKKGTPMTISGTDPSRRASITLTID